MGHNQFVYCNNSPVVYADYTGEDGLTIDLGNGWKCRIDPYNSSTGVKRHIHIWNDKKGLSYSQADDGSPHDKGSNGRGKLPKWLNKEIKKATGWDYNDNRKSFYNKTEVEALDSGMRYTYADGTVVYKPYSAFVRPSSSVSSYEGMYFDKYSPVPKQVNSQIIYIPIFGPVSIPAPTFGFFWGPLPAPILP